VSFALKADRASRLAISQSNVELTCGTLGSDAFGRELARIPHHLAHRVHPPRRFDEQRLDEGRIRRLRLPD
jgi:hypothetical protein